MKMADSSSSRMVMSLVYRVMLKSITAVMVA